MMDLPAHLSTSAADTAEARRDARVPVHFAAGLRRQGMNRLPVRLVDLSVHGFCTEVDDPLPIGTMLWLTLPSLAPLQAQVAWCAGFRIGAKFAVPLHPSVLASIIGRNSG